MPPKNQRFDERQYMSTNTFEVFHYKDTVMKDVALHHHDFYEVYFFLAGNVQYNIESRSCTLTPGDVLLISPMELHQPLFTQEQGVYERMVLWIDKSFLDSLSTANQDLAACFDTTQAYHTNLLRPNGTMRQMLMYYMEMLQQEQSIESPYSQLSALAYLAQILVMLNRMSLQQRREPETKAQADSLVYNVLTYINDHFSEDLTLDHLANKFFISKYHLSREFGRVVGTSVHRYIIQKRLVMAKQMMSEGMSSSVVYQHCGFGDYSNFYRAFKSEYQISPKEFTARLKDSSQRRDGLPRKYLG